MILFLVRIMHPFYSMGDEGAYGGEEGAYGGEEGAYGCEEGTGDEGG
jgi:hypothetical protein